MKLIGSLTSPYVRKVRVALAEKKVECEFVVENVHAPDTTISQFNPLGKIPALVLDDNTCVYDSRVIVEYLDFRAPNHRLIPDAGRERTEVKVWEALCDGMQDAAIAIVMENKRPEALRSQEWIDRQMKKVNNSLAAMSQNLGKNPWAHGTGFSLADISLGVALGYLLLRFPDLDWKKTYPNLQAHYDKLTERQSFKDTVPVV